MISAEETDNAAAAAPSLPPGEYVRIKVVDTEWPWDPVSVSPSSMT